jgi:ketosteroid isomerase-like protein
MKHLRFAAFAVAASVCLCAMAQDAQLKKTIQGNYDKMTKALRANDSKTYFSFMDKSYVRTGKGMTITLEQSKQMFPRQVSMMKSVTRLVATVKSVTVKGSQAIATVEQKIVLKQTGTDGKPHVVAIDGTSKDIWIKSGNGWKLKSGENIKATQTLDGKPIQIPTGQPGKQRGG